MVRAHRTLLVMTFGAACVVVASGACSSSEQMATGVALGQGCKEDSDCAPPTAAYLKDLKVKDSDPGHVRCGGYSDGTIKGAIGFASSSGTAATWARRATKDR